jgi:hypothetical protein
VRTAHRPIGHRRRDGELDRKLGIALEEFREARQQDSIHQHLRPLHAQRALWRAALRGEHGIGFFHAREHLLAVLEVRGAFFSQSNAPRSAVQKLGLQPLFKLLDVLGHRGGR